MPLLCRENEYTRLCQLLCGGDVEWTHTKLPPAIFIHGGPQTGKKSLVSSVLKNLHTKEHLIRKGRQTCKIRSALLSCHLGSVGSSALFEEMWRQINTEHVKDSIAKENPESGCLEVSGGVSNFAELVSRLKTMFENDAKNNVRTSIVIGLTHAEMLRSVESNVLPGLLRLSSIIQSRLSDSSDETRDDYNPVCVILMSRLPWTKWEMDSMTFTPPITVSLAPYTKPQLAELLTQYLIVTSDRQRKGNNENNSELSENLPEEFYRDFSDVILGTFHAVAKSFPQFVSVANMTLPVYMKPIEMKQVDADNSRALYRNAEPFLKKCLSTANLKESYGKSFDEQMKIKMRSFEQTTSTACSTTTMPLEDTKSYSRLSVELPFFSKYLLIAAYLASYNPVKSDKRFFMKYHGKFKKRVQRKSTNVAAHKRSSQLLGPKQFPLDRMLAIFYVVVDMDQDALGCVGSADILSQISSLVTLNLLTQAESGLDTPKYKCNVSLDFVRLVAKNVRFEIHKYLYDIDP